MGQLWRLRLRSMDMKYLWPKCVAIAEERGQGIEGARAAFKAHVFRDEAWTRDFTAEELHRIVASLEPATRRVSA